MAVTTQKIGYNSRGVWSAAVANYTILDTVTYSSGGVTSLYEVIAPAYPGVVPTATPVTNTTYFRLVAQGVQGDTGAGKYACSVWKEGNATTAITGTIGSYNVVWQNDGQLNTTTGVYTVPVTGLYNVQFDCLKHNNNTITEVRLYKNGSATGVRSFMQTTNSSEYINGHFNVTGYFNAGDTLDVRVVFGGVHGNESCYLNIYKVR